MAMLREVGLGVAPFVVLEPGNDADPAIDALGGHLVVKLADVPHRTDLGAVHVDVAPRDVAAAVRDLRAIARAEGLPETVAVQAMITGDGEAFVGIQGRTDLGPVVLFGLGGVLVEVAGQVDGTLLPLTTGAVVRLVENVAGEAAFSRLRGRTPWAPQPLVTAIEAVGALWEREGSWLESADLNPLIVTPQGPVAVDALLVAAADS
jgi:hypothetical protein